MAPLYVLWFVLLMLKVCFGDDSILCTEQYCRDYGFDVGCGTPVQNCRISNATHSGIELPSPTICNCCEFCLAFILEGDSCTLGGAGDGINAARCGPGLTCVAGDNGTRCRRMESPCHRSQDDYDRRHALGETGSLEERPRCDDKARFAPTSCVPTQTCFCQSEDGERILGEAEYRDSNTLLRMHCGCSRRNLVIQRNIGSSLRLPVVGPRCDQTGGFLPYQCDGRRCYCVDPVSGVAVGTQRINLDTQSLEELSCYNAELDLFPYLNSEDVYSNYNYTSPCEEDHSERARLIQQSQLDGYIVDYYTSVTGCLPDGTYGRIRLEPDDRKTCIDERSIQIGNYSISPEDPGYEDMDCKCALTSYLLQHRIERPVCCRNGNFRPVQCRRGQCYCVDADGRQVGRESSDLATLSCYTENWKNC